MSNIGHNIKWVELVSIKMQEELKMVGLSGKVSISTYMDAREEVIPYIRLDIKDFDKIHAKTVFYLIEQFANLNYKGATDVTFSSNTYYSGTHIFEVC